MSIPSSEICNGSALREAGRRISKLYDEALAPTGLGLNQYTALRKLGIYGPITMQKLAQQLVMDRSTLARLLGPLQKRQLLTIEISSDDRRSRVLEVTSKGRALLKKALPLWEHVQRDFEDFYGKEEARRLRASLKRIALAEFGKSGKLTESGRG